MVKLNKKVVACGLVGLMALTGLQGVVKAEYVQGSPFLTEISEDARKIGQEKGVYASVMMAQAYIESGNGTSGLANAYNNLMGIKGAYKDGGTINLPTQEEDEDGELYTIDAYFRVYPNWYSSLDDYADLLRTNPAYVGVLKNVAPDAITAAWELNGVYATDSDYAEKIIDVIQRYNLTRFDKALPKEDVKNKESGIEEKVSKARKSGLFKGLDDKALASILDVLLSYFSAPLSVHDMIIKGSDEIVKNESGVFDSELRR